MVEEVNVFRIIKIVYVNDFLDPRNTFLGEVGALCFLIHHEVFVFFDLIDKAVNFIVFVS